MSRLHSPACTVLLAVLLSCFGLVAIGCGGGGGGSTSQGTATSVQEVIGLGGGTVEIPGEVRLDVPANFVPDGTTVLVTHRSQPFARSAIAKTDTGGIEVELSNDVLNSDAEWTLYVQTPKSSAEIAWTAAIGDESNLTFPATAPKRISDTTVKLVFKGSDFTKESTTSRLPPGPRSRVTPGRVELSASISAGKFFKAKSGTFDRSGTKLVAVSSTESLAGKRVAIVIHGLNNSAEDMVDTAENAQRAAARTGQSYDVIWLYDYHDWTNSIRENAHRMADSLTQHHIAEAKAVDFYGHSMGGLVARSAIEQEGLGAYCNRLFLFGTPSRGVPEFIVSLLHWRLTVGISDLSEDSDFIESLDHDSPYKNKVLYCYFMGSNSDYLGDIGIAIRDYYAFSRPGSGPVDGIVAGRSAFPAGFNQYGVTSQATVHTAHLNHTDIGGAASLEPVLEGMMTSGAEGGVH